jgi:hypothetical protein
VCVEPDQFFIRNKKGFFFSPHLTSEKLSRGIFFNSYLRVLASAPFNSACEHFA